MTHYTLLFAGLARDCAHTVRNNILHILNSTENNPAVSQIKLFIHENDSSDMTLKIIDHLANTKKNIFFHSEKNLDKKYPNRIERLAYCRNFLLSRINEFVNHNDIVSPILYVPIDLDSNIGKSINFLSFFQECKHLLTNNYTGIFPCSTPYYYDIYALRSTNWVNSCFLTNIENSRNKIGTFHAKKKFKYDVQLSLSNLKQKEYHPVSSAFGGLGIYNYSKIANKYYSHLDQNGQTVCEHVSFNFSLKNLFISSKFVIEAPKEFIKYKTSNFFVKFFYALYFFFYDKIYKNFKSNLI